MKAERVDTNEEHNWSRYTSLRDTIMEAATSGHCRAKTHRVSPIGKERKEPVCIAGRDVKLLEF